jgi:hypothetical protein
MTDPQQALAALGAIWSDDFDAYASGQLDLSQVHCALCMCAPCRCPAFGTPAYFALLDARHGRRSSGPAENIAPGQAPDHGLDRSGTGDER